jgi:hypothetical protein
VCDGFKALRVVRATSAGTRVATTTLTIIVNGTVVPNANEFDPDKDEALRKTEIKSEGRRFPIISDFYFADRPSARCSARSKPASS